ncbi:hypothetical protein, partial [Lacisediminihabitans profunda]|uniref:hypothetical protein n=1 Tax=Lacisediminihabitans profunda TaxID=2594790 RepID=UPI001C9CAE92
GSPLSGSGPFRPPPGVMWVTGSLRAASGLQSFPILASGASAGWVQAGWSLHFSPASQDA